MSKKILATYGYRSGIGKTILSIGVRLRELELELFAKAKKG